MARVRHTKCDPTDAAELQRGQRGDNGGVYHAEAAYRLADGTWGGEEARQVNGSEDEREDERPPPGCVRCFLPLPFNVSALLALQAAVCVAFVLPYFPLAVGAQVVIGTVYVLVSQARTMISA